MGFGAKCNLARFLGLYGFVNRCGRVQSPALHVSVTLYFSCSLSIGVKHVCVSSTADTVCHEMSVKQLGYFR